MLLTEYNEERHMRTMEENGAAKIIKILKLHVAGETTEKIAALCNLSLEYVQNILRQVFGNMEVR